MCGLIFFLKMPPKEKKLVPAGKIKIHSTVGPFYIIIPEKVTPFLYLQLV